METLPAELFIIIITQVARSSPKTLFELLVLHRQSRHLLQHYCKYQWTIAARNLVFEDDQTNHLACEHSVSFLLFTSITRSNNRALQALIYSGTNLNIKLKYHGYTPILLSVSMDSYYGTKMLLEAGVDISAVDSDGYSVMHKVCSNGNNSIYDLLQSYSIPLQVMAYSKMTPLHCAAKFGHYSICQTLLKVVGLNDRTLSGKTPLHYAAYHTPQSPEIIQLFADHGADMLVKDIHGYTPLHVAAMHGNSLGVKILLKNQIQVNSQSVNGSTPLHLAVLHDQPVICKSLLQAGADPTIQTNLGDTPMDLLEPENLNMDLRDTFKTTFTIVHFYLLTFSFALFGFTLIGI
jgi:uncharacterized protein